MIKLIVIEEPPYAGDKPMIVEIPWNVPKVIEDSYPVVQAIGQLYIKMLDKQLSPEDFRQRVMEFNDQLRETYGSSAPWVSLHDRDANP